MSETPTFSFDYHPTMAKFGVSKRAYLNAHPDAAFGYIATSALVVETRTASKPRVLLLQRAANDEDPNKWEPPGGACEDGDETILHAAARELWEEAGLRTARIDGTVGKPYYFTLSDGKKVCQYNFKVQVVTADTSGASSFPTVRLNPEEHQDFVWATEDEVTARKVGGTDLDFTTREVERTVLMAFEDCKEATRQ